MSTFNEKFWNDLQPGHYDISFHKGKLDNSIKFVWHYLTFIKQQKFLTSKDNHLDYACGPGTLIGLFSESLSFGYDPSKSQIKYANSKYNDKNKKFSSNFEDIYIQNKFNVVTINGLFEYLSIEEIKQLLIELRDSFDDNCKLIITTPNYGGFFRIIEYLSTVFKIIDYKDVNKSRFNKDSIREVFKEDIYKVVSVKKILNVGVLLSFFSAHLAIKLEKFIEKIFNNKFGFIIMAEIELKNNGV